MNDYVVSLIRTWVPVGVGLAVTWLAREAGIVLDENTGAMASVVAVSAITAVYFAIARLLESRVPQAGRVLLALGLTSKTPEYRPLAPRR